MQLRLTRRADYAVRAVLALAEADSLLTTGELARRMQMPSGFLPQIMPGLVRNGLLQRRLGRHGGYRLARAPRLISLLEVIEAAEATQAVRSCVLRGAACGTDAPCIAHAALVDAEAAQRRSLAAADVESVLRSGSLRPGSPTAAAEPLG